MDKKNYLWIGIALFVIVIIVLLVVKSTGTPAQPASNNQNNPVTTGSETKATDKANTVASNTPNEASATDSLPLSKETILTADGKSFTPKTITVKTGEKVFMTFAATDDARHTFNFIDQDLSFIFVMFSKAEGAKSITFPAPKAGTYTYFVDDKANTGKLIVE
ncbi:MAG: cupredoxin domain-containing protein [Candidatus Falkowbacteria bacterium]